MKRHRSNINPANNQFEVPFVHGGREYTLRKRKQPTDAPWVLRILFRGQAYWRSTNTNDAELAVSKAKPIIDAVLHGNKRFLNETKLRDPLKYATLGQVFEKYRVKAPIARHTVKANINAFTNMARVVFGQEAKVGELTVLQLTPAFVRSFQTKSIERVKAQNLAAAIERPALARAQRTANSIWNQARSLFTSSMMLNYRDAGLVFPDDFTEFVEAPKIDGVDRTRYVQPSDTLIQGTVAALRGIMAKVET